MSRAAGVASFGLPPAAPPPRRAGFLARRWRLLLAIALVGAAGLGLLRAHLTLATDHAVVTAQTLPIRAPIGGEVTDLVGEPGTALPYHLAFARIENSRADRGRLLDAVQERDRARDEMGAVIGQIAALEGLAADLRARGAEHRAVATEQMEAVLRETVELHAAAQARAQRAAQESQRAGDLARGGHASQAARERGEAELEAARREALALAIRVTGLQRVVEGARLGIFTQPGQQGAGYAEQRLDDIALRRAELTAQLSQRQAAVNRAERRLAEEQTQHEAERSAVISPPEGMTLWRLHAHHGQRVLAGEVMAELVDCRAAFLLAAVPQGALPDLSPGSTARLRLAGKREEQIGVVIGRHGEARGREADNLAAQPTRPAGATALVRIALPPLPAGTLCPVGRVARVIFEGPGLAWPW